jgi:hypothetical protein
VQALASWLFAGMHFKSLNSQGKMVRLSKNAVLSMVGTKAAMCEQAFF